MAIDFHRIDGENVCKAEKAFVFAYERKIIIALLYFKNIYLFRLMLQIWTWSMEIL